MRSSTPKPGLSLTLMHFVAAFEGALGAVPFIVVAGLVAFAPIGEAMAGSGVIAAFLGAIIVGALVTGMGGRGLVVGPSAGLALMVTGALQALLDRGALGSDITGAATAIAMALTLSCGVLMAGVSALGVGRMVPLVPYPVLAGLRNGTALLLVLEQTHAAAGMSEHGGDIHPGALIVAAVTIAAMFIRLPGMRAFPPVLLSLAAGIATHHLLALLPAGRLPVGPLMPHTQHGTNDLPLLVAHPGALSGLPFAAITGILLPTILSMMVFALLETVASASIAQSESGERRHNARDVLIVGIANIVGGAAGALPVAGSLEETVPEAIQGSIHSRVTEALRCLFLLALALLAIPLLARVPAAVIAGLIIAAAVKLLDLTSLRRIVASVRTERRHRVEGIGSLLVVTTVTALAAIFGLETAVIAGVLLSLLVFVIDVARGPVRRRYTSPIGRSRARRGERETQALIEHGAAIEVIELHGALFFGSADQVAGAVEPRPTQDRRYTVLDVRRIHRMDLSAARGLLAACERVWREGGWLSLAGMRPGVPAWDYLSDRGLHHRLPPGRSFPTLEDALESAEAQLLADHLGAVADPTLSDAGALAALGIPTTAIASLLQRMDHAVFPAGGVICHAGDISRDLFILLSGHVDVTLPVQALDADPARSTRVATLAPGTLFGEMALLSSAPRSADLRAHGAVTCLRLNADALAALRADDPASAWFLLKAIALQIDMNLRLANAAIASYEE